MKDNRNYCSYQGTLINNKCVNGLSLAEGVHTPHLKLSRHSHRKPVFSLVLRGRYIESYGGISLDCQPLSLKFQPAEEAHSDFFGKNETKGFIVELEPEWLARTGADALVGNNPLVFRNNSLTRLMLNLQKELHSADVETSFVVEGLVLQLIAETSRNRTKILEDKFFKDKPEWLKQAKEFLDDQFTEPLSLSIVAKTVGVHPVYLAHSFRQYYRCSVGEYLRQRRVEFASRLISASSGSLADIALSAGFSNQAHFSRIFKQFTGMSPAQYRAAHRIS